MTHDEQDERLTRILLRDAPPERDPLFRLEVLERRERQRFRRSVLLLVVGVLVILGTLAAGRLMREETYAVARVVLLGTAAVVAVALYVPLFLRLWRVAIVQRG
jgi:hypothetical protein